MLSQQKLNESKIQNISHMILKVGRFYEMVSLNGPTIVKILVCKFINCAATTLKGAQFSCSLGVYPHNCKQQ
jgi:hypothetical protein